MLHCLAAHPSPPNTSHAACACARTPASAPVFPGKTKCTVTNREKESGTHTRRPRLSHRRRERNTQRMEVAATTTSANRARKWRRATSTPRHDCTGNMHACIVARTNHMQPHTRPQTTASAVAACSAPRATQRLGQKGQRKATHSHNRAPRRPADAHVLPPPPSQTTSDVHAMRGGVRGAPHTWPEAACNTRLTAPRARTGPGSQCGQQCAQHPPD
jgi:hypothetical protein